MSALSPVQRLLGTETNKIHVDGVESDGPICINQLCIKHPGPYTHGGGSANFSEFPITRDETGIFRCFGWGRILNATGRMFLGCGNMPMI